MKPRLIKLLSLPEFYDLFGLATFTFLTSVAIWSLSTKLPLPAWASIMILIIGIAGIFIDGTIVYKKFIRRSA